MRCANVKRVTGLGGVFLKAKDPQALYAWYRKHLGIESSPEGGAMWEGESGQTTVWALFPETTEYFRSAQPFMVNFRVDDLEALLRALREEGVQVDEKMEAHAYGKFGWITDPEGNRLELWEPAKEGAGE